MSSNPDDHTLTQALNCLLVETPSGRVLVETGIGERMDEHRRASRGVRGQSILPSLRAAGFDPASVDFVALSHLHFDHAGGLLTVGRGPGLPAGPHRGPGGRVDVRARPEPRLAASYEQDELRIAEPWARPGSAEGDEELIPGVRVRRTSGHSGGHQAIIVRGRDRTVAFIGDLFMRPWSANPKWVTAFDDFPLTSVAVKTKLFAEAAEEGWTIVLSHEPRRPVGRLTAERGRFRFEATI